MSRKITPKRKFKQKTRRRVRRQENADVSETAATSDKTQGQAARRGWGSGQAK